MLDYHNRADETLDQLYEFHGNPCYIAMIKWMTAVYELEKERAARTSDPDLAIMHWSNCRGMIELLNKVDTETE